MKAAFPGFLSTPGSVDRTAAFRLLACLLLLTSVLGTYLIWHHPPKEESDETPHYWPLAQHLAHGQGYTICEPTFFPFCANTNQVSASREPVPVLMFAAVAWLSNDSLLAAAFVTLVVNLGTLIEVFFLARQLGGGPTDYRAALFAAAIWAAYLPALWLVPQVSGDLPVALATTWSLYFFARARDNHQTRDWILAGVLMGVAALCRSVMLFIAVGLAATLIPWRRPRLWRAPVLLFGAAFILVVTPWMVRNYVVFGRFVPGTTLTGFNLYHFNYIVTSDDYFRYVGPKECNIEVMRLVSQNKDLRGNENEAETDEFFRREAVRRIVAQPLRYIALSGYRLLPLWFGGGLIASWKDQGTVDEGGKGQTIWDRFMVFEQALLIGFALFGWRAIGDRGWPAIVSILLFSLAYAMVMTGMRYIVNIMPLVIALSGIGVVRLIDRRTKIETEIPARAGA